MKPRIRVGVVGERRQGLLGRLGSMSPLMASTGPHRGLVETERFDCHFSPPDGPEMLWMRALDVLVVAGAPDRSRRTLLCAAAVGAPLVFACRDDDEERALRLLAAGIGGDEALAARVARNIGATAARRVLEAVERVARPPPLSFVAAGNAVDLSRHRTGDARWQVQMRMTCLRGRVARGSAAHLLVDGAWHPATVVAALDEWWSEVDGRAAGDTGALRLALPSTLPLPAHEIGALLVEAPLPLVDTLPLSADPELLVGTEPVAAAALAAHPKPFPLFLGWSVARATVDAAAALIHLDRKHPAPPHGRCVALSLTTAPSAG